MRLAKSDGLQVLSHINTMFKLGVITDEQRDEFAMLTQKGICGNNYVWKVLEVKLKALCSNESAEAKNALIQECLAIVQ